MKHRRVRGGGGRNPLRQRLGRLDLASHLREVKELSLVDRAALGDQMSNGFLKKLLEPPRVAHASSLASAWVMIPSLSALWASSFPVATALRSFCRAWRSVARSL